LAGVAIEAIFSSVAGGDALRARAMKLIADASAQATTSAVEVNVMTFSFTDPQIAACLAAAAAAQQASLTIRLIADWTQRAADGIQQVGRLAELGLPNLKVRYKKDQPYVWDAADARMRWSYHASRGMLHHKTLSVVVDGEPSRLACGSYNWSAKAADSYENLLIVADSTAGCRELMSRMEKEFEAIWSDDTASLSPADAQAHYEAVAETYRQQAIAAPGPMNSVTLSRAGTLRVLTSRHETPGTLRVPNSRHDTRSEDSNIEPDILIAFSARRPNEEQSRAGYAESNRTRHITLSVPGGRTKRVPLTISTLALDVIYRARPGETLLIAMYGLSTRVPEYGALLNAARAGVRLKILLDRKVGKRTAESLSLARLREDLPIQVKSGYRMMHEKYIVNVDTATVLTGTANMSTDASMRHSEHRIRVLGDSGLADQFAADFETIWNRVSNPV
jgi:phosphatidylserine/phosphatidylglycerophosphate/cardiolipin synthase-like enzyme